jgi:thiamine biosynthesis protein ThiS
MSVRVLINGEEKGLPGPISVSDLLDRFELPSQRVAIELNKIVIRKSNWTETLVNDGDRIEVVHFVGGG